MTAGIKLSNLHLRDGDGTWRSLKNAYIGDLWNNSGSPSTLTLVEFVQYVKDLVDNSPVVPGSSGTSGGLDLTKLFFQTTTGNNSKLELRYDTTPTGASTSTSTLIADILKSNIDTNTTYSLTKENLTRDGETDEYLVFKGSDNTRVEIRLTDNATAGFSLVASAGIGIITDGKKGFWPDAGVGVFSGGINGSGPGGVTVYDGDGSTISVSNHTVSLYNRGAVSTTTAASSLGYGNTFKAISAINVDEYGRVTSVTTTTYTLPSAASIMNVTAVQNSVKSYAQSEIDAMLSVS